MNNIGIVFLTGAGFDNSIWNDTAGQLNVPYVAVNYPERHNGDAALSLTFDQYIESAMQQIATLKTEKIVLVGHSIGGVVMMQLSEALKDRIVGRVAIAAAIPASGGSFLSCLPQPKRFIMGIVLKLAGTKVPPSAIRSSLCSDLTDDQAKVIVDGFTAESRALYTTSVAYEKIDVPALYIVTTKDPEFDAAWQRDMAGHLQAETAEIAASHLPMVGQPQAMANLIGGFLKKL